MMVLTSSTTLRHYLKIFMKNSIILTLISVLFVGCSASSDSSDTPPKTTSSSNDYYHFVLDGDVIEQPTNPVNGDKIYEIYSVHHLTIDMLLAPSIGASDPNFLVLNYYKSETSQESYNVEEDYYNDGLVLECDIPDFLVENIMAFKGYIDLTNQTLMLKSDERKDIPDNLPFTPCIMGPAGYTASANIGVMNIIYGALNSNLYLVGTVNKDSSILDSTVETPILFDGEYERDYGLSIKPMNISYAPTLTYQGTLSDVTKEDLKGWVNALTQEIL